MQGSVGLASTYLCSTSRCYTTPETHTLNGRRRGDTHHLSSRPRPAVVHSQIQRLLRLLFHQYLHGYITVTRERASVSTNLCVCFQTARTKHISLLQADYGHHGKPRLTMLPSPTLLPLYLRMLRGSFKSTPMNEAPAYQTRRVSQITRDARTREK